MADTATIDNLPDSDFAYIEPGGTVVDGKTTPRSLRHFPIHDEAHVRNALARLSQSPFGDKARAKVEAAARRMGIGEPAGKAFTEMKAEPLTTAAMDAWLKGERSRRLLVLPFGGRIPTKFSKAGVDIDFETFYAGTDIYGGFPSLLASRKRAVDFHHEDDPTGVMKGAILGYVEMDDHPESVEVDDIIATGIWGNFWANAGERRKRLIAYHEAQGMRFYGSSEAVPGAVRKSDLGFDDVHGKMVRQIDVWPIRRETITTSPQNNIAVMPSLKAVLTVPTIDEIPADALKALLVGLDANSLELLLSSPSAAVTASALAGDAAVKSGRVLSKKNLTDLRTAIDLLGDLFARGLLLPEEEETTSSD